MLKIEGETFLRVNEVVEFLGITPPTLTKYRKQGRIEGVRVGKRWVYSSWSVRDFLRGGVSHFGYTRDPKTGCIV